MMKKWMCIMLSLAVLLSTGPVTAAWAEADGITEKELTAYIYGMDECPTNRFAAMRETILISPGGGRLALSLAIEQG